MSLRAQALENRRELSVWRSVGENAQEGILLVAPDLTVSEMNPAAEWMLGYADWEAKGQPNPPLPPPTGGVFSIPESSNIR